MDARSRKREEGKKKSQRRALVCQAKRLLYRTMKKKRYTGKKARRDIGGVAKVHGIDEALGCASKNVERPHVRATRPVRCRWGIPHDICAQTSMSALQHLNEGQWSRNRFFATAGAA